MSNNKIKIEVDGRELEAEAGQMLIEVTDAADIYVPRFCYHHKLSVAANCRMCLVEVEKAPKPLPACATPVTDGMRVFTRSEYAIEAQKANMEFLLINHPLDCPICDQGGECELQDIAMGYGRDISRYNEGKRVVKDKDLGPLVSSDMTRCIHCTRCVRFGQEIAGIQELGAMGRGDTMEIGTFIEMSVDHELSGNIIDLCPVGALNNKPYRMSARAWEMEQRASIAPHDCLGSNVYAHVLRGKVMRIVPRENEGINETWLSDRDRFSYEGIYSSDRLLTPLVRVNGKLEPQSWEQALQAAADGIGRIAGKDGGEGIGAWVSPSATIEEGFLASRLLSHLGSNNIDYRLRRRDFRGQAEEPVVPVLGRNIAEHEALDACLVIGSNLRNEVPLLAHRLRIAANAGGAVSFINPGSYDYLFPVANYIQSDTAELVAELAAVVSAAGGTDLSMPAAESREVHQQIADSLRAEQSSILIGHVGQRHPAYAQLWQLASRLSELTGATVGLITEGANAAGLAFAGAVPHHGPAGTAASQKGANFCEMLASPVKGLIQIGVEPELDCADSVAAIQAMGDAEFCVVLSPWLTGSARDKADVILPIGTFAETSGTFANGENCWQSFNGVANPVGESRPGWKVLRVLANLLDVPGSDYATSAEIRDELQLLQVSVAVAPDSVSLDAESALTVKTADLEIPMYSVDPLVRRAEALQQTQAAVPGWRKTA
jgi:NADH-quinone oxidoreductase subunit G